MIRTRYQTTKRLRLFVSMGILLAFACLAFLLLHPLMNNRWVSNFLPSFSSAAKAPLSSSDDASFLYGENVDMSQVLPSSAYYIVNSKGQDLIDIAAELGIKMIRLTNAQRSFNNNADSLYTKAQWDQVLNKMQSKGIKALILIETETNNADYYAPDIRPYYLHLVQAYIDSGVFSHPDVYGVDIKNEPLLTAANLTMLHTAHDMIKARYPHLRQTIGWWATPKTLTDPYNPNNYDWANYSTGQKLADIVDFYSIHMYGDLDSNYLGLGLHPDLQAKAFLSEVENGLQTQKPILIEEFGEANGDAVSDQETIGSPQLQANIYQGVYQALKEMHNNQIIGVLAFDFYSRDQYPDAWAIVKNHGDFLFPAAYILQEYALGKNNPSLKEATVVTTASYLVKNADNHTTKELHMSDRLGLKLQLDSTSNYTISIQGNGGLQPSETFHYDPVSDSYYAVYQAVRKGTAYLTVVSHSTCSSSNACNKSVYALIITIQ